MSAPLVVSIPHSLGREEAMRRLKDRTDARGVQRADAEGRRGAVGRQSHDLSRCARSGRRPRVMSTSPTIM